MRKLVGITSIAIRAGIVVLQIGSHERVTGTLTEVSLAGSGRRDGRRRTGRRLLSPGRDTGNRSLESACFEIMRLEGIMGSICVGTRNSMPFEMGSAIFVQRATKFFWSTTVIDLVRSEVFCVESVTPELACLGTQRDLSSGHWGIFAGSSSPVLPITASLPQ